MNPTTALFGLMNGELLTHPAAGPRVAVVSGGNVDPQRYVELLTG